jgi:predicted secreted protein
MEYKDTHQARFSNDYLLLIGKDAAGVWRIQINGPRPTSGSLESIHLSDAQSEAYSAAVQYFMQKGIVDPRIPREEIVWVAHP